VPGTSVFLLHIHSQYLDNPAAIVLILSRYNYTSPTHLVNRLTSRNLHLLALRISTYLSLKPDAVLKHWACVKITKSKLSATGTGKDGELQGDEEVCQSIVEKFSKLGGGSVSYADIAKKAWEVGRLDLATKVPSSSYPLPHGVLT
jgi:vacuolar protein sorting-associated protein 16